MTKSDSCLESFITSSRRNFESILAEMVETPSISSDPSRSRDIRAMANLAVQVLKRFGAKAQIVETSGYPAVSGGWFMGNQYPTVTIYNHLDVQPADEPEWRQSPFLFHKEGDRYCGRGTTDDKGPALTALFAARFVAEQKTPLIFDFCGNLKKKLAVRTFRKLSIKPNGFPDRTLSLSRIPSG